tara:strand:+ start:2914 stop:3354 length:441 start_codon:yes stop_codon:yes gene_type:complete
MQLKLIYSKLLKVICTPLFLSFLLLDMSSINNEIYANNKKLLPANDDDLYLYKGIGASYLCIATKAGVEFKKATGIATATYVQVLEGKHGGIVKELGKKKIEREKLFAGAEFQIVTTAMQYCPDNVPKDISEKVEKIMDKNFKNKK